MLFSFYVSTIVLWEGGFFAGISSNRFRAILQLADTDSGKDEKRNVRANSLRPDIEINLAEFIV
ncbi:hypothetical protein HMPREF1981_02619 [Bacteroides pyogenes F0041]|uniref:Uncharacterized protein n=1 Tax=Bacteroides pyogenes F0041 TaxID=1321819 RepID=U2BZU5_9BACE|nr:hypothetical protein HMPREF1981_02619 [Bacteroides pyogenes F0041]